MNSAKASNQHHVFMCGGSILGFVGICMSIIGAEHAAKYQLFQFSGWSLLVISSFLNLYLSKLISANENDISQGIKHELPELNRRIFLFKHLPKTIRFLMLGGGLCVLVGTVMGAFS